MGVYGTRSRTRRNTVDISDQSQYTSSRNRLLCRANELSQQHGCQVAVIVIKEGQVTQYSSCEMVDVLKQYSDMCTQPHLSLNKADFEKCEESKQKETKKTSSTSDIVLSGTPSAEEGFNYVVPVSLYAQSEFNVGEHSYLVQPDREEYRQDLMRDFEWYAQEMQEQADLISHGSPHLRESSPGLKIDLPLSSSLYEFETQHNLFDSMEDDICHSVDFYNSAPIPQQFLENFNCERQQSRPESSPSNTTNDVQFTLGGVRVQ